MKGEHRNAKHEWTPEITLVGTTNSSSNRNQRHSHQLKDTSVSRSGLLSTLCLQGCIILEYFIMLEEMNMKALEGGTEHG